MSTGTDVTHRVLTLPNVLSIVRLLLLPVFVVGLLAGELLWAAGVLALAGFTDYLDGRIARGFGLESRLGQLLDPIADRMYIAATLLGLAWVGAIPWWLLVVLLGRDAFILAMAPLVARFRLPIPPVDFVGKAATFCLLGAFPLLLVGAVDGWWTTAALVVGWALAWWGTTLYWVTGLIYAWQVQDMLRQRRALGGAR